MVQWWNEHCPKSDPYSNGHSSWNMEANNFKFEILVAQTVYFVRNNFGTMKLTQARVIQKTNVTYYKKHPVQPLATFVPKIFNIIGLAAEIWAIEPPEPLRPKRKVMVQSTICWPRWQFPEMHSLQLLGMKDWIIGHIGIELYLWHWSGWWDISYWAHLKPLRPKCHAVFRFWIVLDTFTKPCNKAALSDSDYIWLF